MFFSRAGTVVSMPQPKRPGGAGKSGARPKTLAEETRKLTQILVAKARIVHGIVGHKEIYEWVAKQDVWTERFPEYGPPGPQLVRNVTEELTPAKIDLCANLENEEVARTAAEERRAAIVRHRETVNRWYGIERSLVVERDAVLEESTPKELSLLERRIGEAQEQRMVAERELAAATSAIDDESFDSAALRSEVLAILARNRHHFTLEEAHRVLAIFAVGNAEDAEPDPDMPEYMQ